MFLITVDSETCGKLPDADSSYFGAEGLSSPFEAQPTKITEKTAINVNNVFKTFFFIFPPNLRAQNQNPKLNICKANRLKISL